MKFVRIHIIVRLVWAVIPLILIVSMIGVQESFATIPTVEGTPIGTFAICDSGIKIHTVYTDFDKLELVIGVGDEGLEDDITKVLGDTPYRLEIGEP